MTKITQLPVATTISNSGVFVIVDGGITKQLSWQTLIGGGLKGNTGTTGSTGTIGPTGPMGTIVSVQVGSVSGGTTASVTVTTSTTSVSTQILDFVLPQGEKGDTGVVSWSALTDSAVPQSDAAIGLGNASRRWKDLYLNTNLFLGGVTFATTASQTTTMLVYISTNTAATQFTVLDTTGITTGNTFIAYYSTGTAGVGVVDQIIGDDVYFVDPVTFDSAFTTGNDITFFGPDSLTIDGAAIDVPAYTLQTATTVILGGVKIGSGITADVDGTIHATTATQYVLPTATDGVLGGVKIGAGIGLTDGVISVTTGAFALQTATTVILGGVKIGEGIDISSTGTISINPAVTLASGLTGAVLSSSIVTSSLTSVGTLTELVVQGNTTLQQTLEVYTSLTTATGIVVHDCSISPVFVHSGATSNWAANFTNVPTTNTRVISVAVLVNQGITPYLPSVVQINGQAQTINWHSGITPTGNANKKDLVNFTFISPATTATTLYTVLGSLASYG